MALERVAGRGPRAEHEGRRATFLPQVWESIPDKRAFLGELLKLLDSLHLTERTLIIVHSSHGDDLGERGGYFHYDVSDGVIRGALLIRFPWGAFGENLTVAGLAEEGVRLGDRFRIGTAVLAATKPRFPCYKLGIKFGREDLVDRFLASGRTGFYLRVVKEGELGSGDPIEVQGGGEGQPTIADLVAARQADQG